MSSVRRKIMPLKLKLTVYKILIFQFLNLNNSNKNVSNSNKEFFILKTFGFYNDIFSKNNSLFKYLKNLKNKNLFNFYLNINTIH